MADAQAGIEGRHDGALGARLAAELARFLIDTKNCGTRGGWAWRLLKVTAPRLLASDVPTAAPRATLSLDVNVARAGDDYDSGDVQ